MKIDREKLEFFIACAGQEQQIVKARIVSPQGYEPFEIWTHSGPYTVPGQPVSVTRKHVDYRSRRRCIVPGITEPIPRAYVFSYSKDSQHIAHVHLKRVNNTIHTSIHVVTTQDTMPVSTIPVSYEGTFVLEKSGTLLKFSNDRSRLLMRMILTGSTFPVLVVFTVETGEYQAMEWDDMPEGTTNIATWTPDDTGIVWVVRKFNRDAVYFYDVIKNQVEKLFKTTKLIKHLEFTPSGDQLITFSTPRRHDDTDRETVIVGCKWPIVKGVVERWTVRFDNKHQFRSVPDRAWSMDGKRLVINTVGMCQPKIVVFHLDTKTLQYVEGHLFKGFIHDFHDDELLVEHALTKTATRVIYLVKLPELELPLDDLKWRQIRRFKMITLMDNVDTLLIHPVNGISGFFMVTNKAKESGKVPCIVIPHNGDGPMTIAETQSAGVRVMLHAGFSVFQVNYKHPTETGYSTCRGLPSEGGRADSEDIIDAVHRLRNTKKGRIIDPLNLFLFGRKYGCFVCARTIATKFMFKAAVLVEPSLHFFCSCTGHSDEVIEAAKNEEPHMIADSIHTGVMVMMNEEEKSGVINLPEFINALKKNKVIRDFKSINLKDERYVIDCLQWFIQFMLCTHGIKTDEKGNVIKDP